MFFMRFGDNLKNVDKIRKDEFTPLHREILTQIKLNDGKLVIPNEEWYSMLLGAGEEKAVFCICDHNNRVFALEVIDEKHYLNGRFIGGSYFFNMRIQGLINEKLNPQSLIGLTFTGLIKVREYLHGYEWGRFCFSPLKKSIFDSILTSFLQSQFINQYKNFEQHYKDVHDRNIMFEICDFKTKGIGIFAKDYSGKIKWCKIKLKAIDVR